MFIAEYESRNFTFEGAGDTEYEARFMLMKALRFHCKQRGAVLKEFYFPDDVEVRKIEPGVGFIDKQEVVSRKK